MSETTNADRDEMRREGETHIGETPLHAHPRHGHPVHPASEREASDGAGTVSAPRRGETMDHPILDGSTEYYGEEAEDLNSRYGLEDPGLIRHPETGEKTPVPDESV